VTGTAPMSKARKKRKAFIIAALIAVAGVLALLAYQAYSRTHLRTDDAFVEGSVHIIGARVHGTILEVAVSDNEGVSEGALLVRLDPEPFQQALREAEAALSVEKNRAAEVKAMAVAREKRFAAAAAFLLQVQDKEEELAAALAARAAEVRAGEAGMAQARLDLERARTLWEKEVIPKSRLDRAQTMLELEMAALEAAVARQRQARSALNAHKGSIAQAEAGMRAEEAALEETKASFETQKEQVARQQARADMARLNLEYTEVLAPADGFVTRMSAEVGNTVSAGQPLMSIVSLQDAFVLANYKETRVGLIRPGQKVVMTMDAWPGRKFPGKVDSVMAGTGAAFTLFPPENASGNYVKVVQRVPVKITFQDLEAARPFLKIGISVVPTILTGER